MKGDRFILAIINYFSKRAKVIPLIKVKTSNTDNFIKHHIIRWFGVPKQIIHDNGPQFSSQVFYRFCHKYQVQNVASTTYNPVANGLVEAFNKIIIKLLKKFISSSKWDRNEKQSECLWVYRTMVRASIGNTPFSLLYKYEAVIPLDIQMSSLRVTLATKMIKEDNDRLHLQELEVLDERWLQAQ